MMKLRNYQRSFCAVLAAGAAALGLSWFLRSAEPTVIKTYTENGREITLLDLDGNLQTVEERVTTGSFPAYGSEPPVGGYTEKREFEPPIEKDGRKVNTEVSFYDGNKKRVEGPIRTLEPRQGRLEIPEEKTDFAAVARALKNMSENNLEDVRYAKMAERVWKYVVDTGGQIYIDGDRLMGNIDDQLNFIETDVNHKDGERFAVKSFGDGGGIIGVVPMNGLDPRMSLHLVKIDDSADQSERREFNDTNLDGKITEDESGDTTKEYRWFLNFVAKDLGLGTD